MRHIIASGLVTSLFVTSLGVVGSAPLAWSAQDAGMGNARPQNAGGQNAGGQNAGGQNAGGQTSAADLSRVRVELRRVNDRLPAIQRTLDRAARTNAPALRDEALDDWQRALDGLKPYVAGLAENVPEERAMLAEYDRLITTFNEAAGAAAGGQFYLAMTRDWTAMTAGTDGWQQEQPSQTFEWIATTRPADAEANPLGMPKTTAFVVASDKYLADVRARDGYGRFKEFPNVRNDLRQTEVARAQAQEKLATAADQMLVEAANGTLDQQRRDRLEAFVERDLTAALSGSSAQPGLQSRGRRLVHAYDKQHLGDQAAAEKARERLTRSAEAAWPAVAARYAAATPTPTPAGATGRGQVITIRDALNLKDKDFPASGYDFAGLIDGSAVVGNFDPAIREQVKEVLAQTAMTELPADTRYEMVGIVRGTTQVPLVQTRAAATTAPTTPLPPTTAAAVGAATRPVTQALPAQATLIDIVAVRAGPLLATANPANPANPVTPQGRPGE